MQFPIIYDVPHITRDQMVEVDRLMVGQFGITLIRMMENAGGSLARLARARFLNGDANNKSILVLAGPGGNGGGALVAARRLANWGAQVTVCLSHALDRLTDVPRQQYDILLNMDVPFDRMPLDQHFDIILDGLFGYSLNGPPQGASADLIRFANAHAAPTLALDVPSGLDVTSAEFHDPTITAAATMTLALPKSGLSKATQVGELYCADISVPPGLYDQLNINLAPTNIFARSDIIRVRQNRFH